MRPILLPAILAVLALIPLSGHAQSLADSCGASSSFDLTVGAQALRFDRPGPAPQRIELSHGDLTIDGVAVRQRPDQQDAASLFERQLRALVPRVRAVAERGVDVAAQGIREEARELKLQPATQAELAQRVSDSAASLKQRIARSNSTHDWQGTVFDDYAQQWLGQLAPLVAGDLGQQALQAAMAGDLQQAAALRDEAGDLAGSLRPRMERRLQVLRPQIQALCPAVRQLYELQRELTDAQGRPLNLLQLDNRQG